MTPDKAQQRIDEITTMQDQLSRLLLISGGVLLAELLSKADVLLTEPAKLSAILARFEKQQMAPIYSQVRADLLQVVDLNSQYFKPDPAIIDQVSTVLLDRIGLNADGSVIRGGLLDTIAADNTARVQLTKFVYGQKSAGVGPKEFIKNLRSFIGPTAKRGNVPAKPGLWEKQLQNSVFDLYQQTDRLAQDSYATELGLSHFLYLGGTITGTRPFCRERNGKVFSRAEIAKFGTPADAFGGYSNKSTGTFAGKPSPYNPFMQAGGYSCRHHFSAISDREAFRRRPELKP